MQPASDAVALTVTTRRELLDAGWSEGRLTRALRDRRLVRAHAGTYLVAADASDVTHRVRSAATHFGPDTVAVLGTAARLHGLPEPWPTDGRVHIRLPPGREQVQRPGLRIHTWLLQDDECTALDGVRVTTVMRTLVDLMCVCDRLSAISALDAALAHGLVTRQDLEIAAAQTTRRRGAARSRPWWTQADGRAESPLETRARLRATDGGFPPDQLQKEFLVRGRLYRTDFAWKTPSGRWLVGEADGHGPHDSPSALYRDRARANALVTTGAIDMVRFVWADTVNAERIPQTLAPILRT